MASKPNAFVRCADCPMEGSGMCDLNCAAQSQDIQLHPATQALGVPELLEEMARTFRKRNAVYADNWKMVGKLMKVMFPNGVQLADPEDYDVWHLFELMIVKLSRFAVSGLNHQDSLHDMAVYAAMVEAILKQRKEKLNVVA